MQTLNRNTILPYLKKIYCNGMIPQIALSPKLYTKAISEDQSLIVEWEGLPESDLVFEDAVGINYLSLFVNALEKVGSELYLYMDDYRMVVEGPNSRVSYRLVVGHPEQVVTKFPQKAMDKIRNGMKGLEEQEVPFNVFAEASNALRALSTESIVLEVYDEGSAFVVGGGTENIADINIPELRGESEYKLAFPENTFVGVVSNLDKENPIFVTLTGSGGMVQIRQGTLRYFLQPGIVE